MTSAQTLDLIHSLIASIPRGRVATYGQIAALAGLPRHARLVGRALREVSDDMDLPWHRVVNHAGSISERNSPSSERDQRRLLEAEGVQFRGQRVDMSRFQWDP
ncbi:MAG: MGMT family protein [Candidatus Krumholzibacteria bacterium]|nr:MGMT family protein [Candidatus Krumholzibacteria bacterium]MDH4337039.1 MGMT family protein [Candidatus Krumholzibacteria bacterium]MDH5268576.1 MGMT family protein [Candidatus Krumholzibacteria bacterium]